MMMMRRRRRRRREEEEEDVIKSKDGNEVTMNEYYAQSVH